MTHSRGFLRAGAAIFFWLLSVSSGWAQDRSAEASLQLRDLDRILLRTAQFSVTEGAPAAPDGLALREVEATAARYWIVHLRGPVGRRARTSLVDGGAEVLRYLPNSAYIVRAGAESIARLRRLAAVDWIGRYRPDYKLDPAIGRAVFSDPDRPVVAGERLLVVSVFPGESLDAVAAAVNSAGGELIARPNDASERAPRLIVRVSVGGEARLAHIEGVEWIEELGEISLRNDTTRWVAQSNVASLTPIWDAGLSGAGQVIGHIDNALNINNCYFEDLIDNTPGPLHRKVVAYRGALGSFSHGTHTAGTAAGINSGGGLANAGMAYDAKLSHTRYDVLNGWNDTASNLYTYFALANADDAHVHTNSWGDDGQTGYTWFCRDIDRFTRDFEDDLVLFAVTNQSTLKSPENAKNVLAVGATRQAPSQHLIGSGGQGPTWDGRRKPEIFLPGIGIVSASGTCATNANSGTSMACPAVSACATLTRQYYTEGFYPTGSASPADAFVPTGALLKATLLNATEDMTGVLGYPTNREGWGRLMLDHSLFLAGDAREIIVKDVRHAIGLSTGEIDEYAFDAGAGDALQITMVFTDVPAAHAAALAPVNDLDLEVEGPDGIFLGNVFSGGSSLIGGSPDNLNNVERVVLPAAGFTAGIWKVRVRGASVPDGPQGYAVHISGDVSEMAAVAAPAFAESASDDGFLLAQNRPNPCLGSTTIRFTLPTPNDVVLSVFDISGRRVRVLREGHLLAGEHAATWDARDVTGEEVAAGIYFYRLEGSGIDETRKMVVVR